MFSFDNVAAQVPLLSEQQKTVLLTEAGVQIQKN